MRQLTAYFLIVALFIFPDSASAQLVSCNGIDCTICDAASMANNIINWIISLMAVIAILIMAAAGFKLVTSAGNTEARDWAKARFKNVIIGFLIVLSAWLIVDTVMKQLTGSGLEVWGRYEISECVGMFETTEVYYQDLEIESTASPFDGYGDSGSGVGAGGTGGGTGEMSPDATADGSFTYQSGISSQRSHASQQLNSLLNCMADLVPGDVGEISSISDSRIVNGTETFATCVQGGCAHTRGSAHYGGFGCLGRSYAVDFGDEWNRDVLCRAARSCGTVNECAIHNGNHVHIQMPYPPNCN